MQRLVYFFGFLLFLFANTRSAFAQELNDSMRTGGKKSKDSAYIIRLDTLVHVQSWISKNEMNYTLIYKNGLKLVLAPNKMNSLSFGFTYRYLDLGLSFTPGFLNAKQNDNKKGKSELFGFKTSVSLYRFNLGFDINSTKGFYLKNSKDFLRSTFPDSAYLVYPDLKVGYFSVLLRYNVNPKFSTATLSGGSQIQARSAYTVLPSLQFATFKFHNGSGSSGVHNESTYSTDLNLLIPLAGTLAISPKFSASLGIGPSIGVDFFKSVSIDDSNKLVLSKGTEFTVGYTLQTAIGFHTDRFFSGFESRVRTYGHEIENVSRLIKQYFYFQVFIGWRLRAPVFAKKTLDWVNKISPIDLD